MFVYFLKNANPKCPVTVKASVLKQSLWRGKKLLRGATLRLKKARRSWQCVSATFEFIMFACNFMLMIKVGGGGVGFS